MLYIALIAASCFGFSVFAQEDRRVSDTNALRDALGDSISQNAMLARSSADYRVTAGDVYMLAYAAGITPVTYVITVDSSYRIRVSNLGIVNGAGKTFMQVKNEVETIVTNNYPLSGVQLVLTQPAVFKVHVKGEVPVAEEVPVWALSRLSSLVIRNEQIQKDAEEAASVVSAISASGLPLMPPKDTFAPSSLSLRDVSIRSSNGQVRVYDLFKAQRLGDLSQDPYLRPGDEITFNRAKRSVSITGEVERPGIYQLLEDESINELIEFYGSGFTPLADKTRIELVRIVNSIDIAGDKIFLTGNDLEKNYQLENYDRITVPEITQLQPVMFVEGAVTDTPQLLGGDMRSLAGSTTSELVATNRLVVQFNNGETYASLVRRNVNWFTAVSDTQNAYILRSNQRIPINLNPVLYDASYRGEVFVEENDVLIIPFRQYFVTVAGAVVNPGRYPYIPDRDWEYYIALAGGFMAGYNNFDSVAIADMAGKKMKKTDAITPETVITARANHPLYVFNQIAPVVTTILTAVSTFLSIWAITTR
jgi:protein involved in polysaccharide export with SLBB domain